MALEDNVHELLENAVKAGWDADEALAAIIAIADNTTLAIYANEQFSVETVLKRHRKKKTSKPGAPSKITKRILAFEKSQTQYITSDFREVRHDHKLWLLMAIFLTISVAFMIWTIS